MNIKKILFSLSVFLLSVLSIQAQKNITKPNVQSHNGVSVNTYSGALFHQRQDLFIPGRGLSLDLTFSYTNVSKDKDWGFGRGWTMNYNMSYYTDTMDIVIVHMDGSRNRYVPNGSGGFLFPAGNFDSLEQYQPDKYRLRNKEGMQYFFDDDTHKKLTKIQDRNGNAITLSYTDTLLTHLTDASGRQVNLTWQDGRLITITDPNTTPARTITFEYDSQGNPVKVTDPLGNYMEYMYDDDFNLVSVINENGSPLNIEYNSLSSVRRLISCVGIQQITYNYDLLRTYVVEKVGGRDQITTYQYDEFGRLIQQTGNCCGVNVQFEYDSNNNITKRIDANGNATTFTYDAMGNVLTETDPLGNTMQYAYEPVYNQVTSETDRKGNTTTYTYDANGNLTQVSRPLGITESFTYDAFGNTLTYTDGKGNVTNYTYDVHGNLTSVTDPLGGVTNFAYDGVGNNVTIEDQNNHTTTVEYDLLNRQIKVTDALSNFVEYTYDAVGNQTTYKDENGNVTNMSYDGVNRLTSVIDPLGNVFTYQYDEKGNVTALVAENGDITEFEYNELNRLVQKKSPVGDLTTYEYDGVGNLTFVNLPGGNAVTLAYDPLNRVQTISDNIGVVSSYTYDKNSNRLTVTDGNNNTTKYFYDALDRISKMEDPKGQAVQYTYDNNFNLTQVTDRKSNISTFTYDALNRRISSKDPLNNTTAYSYDAVGNLLSLDDANGNTTLYSYDPVNRRISEVFDTGDTRTYGYDPAGNLIARTEPNGYTINYAYDNDNRLISRTYPGSVTESFTYDAKGRILTATNAHSTVQMAYDGMDRLISETLNGLTTSYSYNTNTLNRQINYPGGKQVLETYDQRGRMLRINDSAIPGNPLSEFEYDPTNRLLKKIFANGTASEFEYDVNSNITQIHHMLNSLHGFEYDYDANDNKLYEKNIGAPNNSDQFSYDAYNRLTQFKQGTLTGSTIPSPVEEIVYNYDGVQNRSTVTVNGVSTTYSSNVLNQYTMLSGGNNATLTYDNNGNLTGDGTHTYDYDFENRLSQIDGGGTGGYYYDALGRRILKVVGSDSTFFHYAGINVIEERGNNGVLEATYVHGIGEDEIISMERGGNRYYYYHNALGSVTHLANNGGALMERYEYDAYGKVSFFDGSGTSLPSSAVGNPYLYTGQRYDEESGLYYYKARYYSAELGRFLQRDPLGYGDGMSLYEYVFSNPANWVDPMGLSGNPCDRPWWEGPLDWLQTGLDVAGLVPGVGEVADGINALIYAARGDWANAALSGAAMVPFAGWGATAAKAANKIDNAVDAARAADNIGDAARAAGRGGNDIPVGGGRGGGGGDGPNFGGNGGGGPPASTPVGRRNSPMDVPPGTNSPTNINGRDYTGHAVDRMQGRGVPPSAVENAIQHGTPSPGNTPGTTVYTDSVNGVRVVTNSDGGVITVIPSGRGN